MNIVARNELTFHGLTFNTTEHKGQVWFTAAELAKALEYKKTDAVTQIYSRAKDEFTESMTTTLNLRVVRKTGDVDMNVRVFSLRGAHLVAMFAGTPVAKEFRRWVLDILDRGTGDQVELSPLYRYTTTVTIKDNLFGGEVAFMGKSNDFNNMATGICETLGFKPLGFSAVKPSFETMKRIH